jgi:small membrane protein
VIVSLLLILIIVLGIYIASHHLSGLQLLGAITMLACGTTLVVFPNVTSFVATQLGVGRGTDLLLYFSVITGMFIAAHLHFQIRRHDEIFARVVRELALLQARRDDSNTLVSSHEK